MSIVGPAPCVSETITLHMPSNHDIIMETTEFCYMTQSLGINYATSVKRQSAWPLECTSGIQSSYIKQNSIWCGTEAAWGGSWRK